MFLPFDGSRTPKPPIELNQGSPQAKGLVVWFPAVDRGDTVRDYSGFSNDGTLENMEPSDWVHSPFGGGALEFGGTNEHAVLPNIDIGTGPLTVSCWFQTSTSGATQILIAQRDDSVGGTFPHLFMRIQTGNQVRVQVATNASNFVNITSTTTVTDGEPHHAAFVWKGGNDITLYIDGVSEGSPSATGTAGNVDSSDAWSLACDFDSGGTARFVFTGTMWEPRINKAALSASAVKSMFNPSTRWDLYARPKPVIGLAVAAGGLSIPIAAYHYNHNVGSNL